MVDRSATVFACSLSLHHLHVRPGPAAFRPRQPAVLVLGDARKAAERPRSAAVEPNGPREVPRASDEVSYPGTPQLGYRHVYPRPWHQGCLKQGTISTESKQEAVCQPAASKPRLARYASQESFEIMSRQRSLPLRPPVPVQQRRPSPALKDQTPISPGRINSARQLRRSATARGCTYTKTTGLNRAATDGMQGTSQSKQMQQKQKAGTVAASESSKMKVLQNRRRSCQANGTHCSQPPACEKLKFELNLQHLSCRGNSQKVADSQQEDLASTSGNNPPSSAVSSSSSTDVPPAQDQAATVGSTGARAFRVERTDIVSMEPAAEELRESECLSTPRSVCSSLPLNTARSALIVGPGAACEADTLRPERLSSD